MKLKKQLRHINLAGMDTSSFTIHEALSAEIYLEHVNDKRDREKGHAAPFLIRTHERQLSKRNPISCKLECSVHTRIQIVFLL